MITFTNVYDKGYRAKLVAWRAGKQRVLPPVWAESNKWFGRDEKLLTEAVAQDRGANERAVNVCKQSRMMKCEFYLGINPTRFNYMCRVWAFGANFMCKSIL